MIGAPPFDSHTLSAARTQGLARVYSSYVVLALPTSVYSALGVIAAGSILFAFEWRMALLACIGIPLCLVGPKLIGPKAQRLDYEMKWNVRQT